MDEKFRQILNALPDKQPHSRLEPYHELINELRQRGRTYKEIARILGEKCQLKTSRSAINDFVRIRSRRKSAKCQTAGSEKPAREGTAKTSSTKNANSPDEVRQRIAELKQQPVVTQTVPKVFHYDPDEPLRLTPKKNRE
jgi:hypothetical protein